MTCWNSATTPTPAAASRSVRSAAAEWVQDKTGAWEFREIFDQL